MSNERWIPVMRKKELRAGDVVRVTDRYFSDDPEMCRVTVNYGQIIDLSSADGEFYKTAILATEKLCAPGKEKMRQRVSVQIDLNAVEPGREFTILDASLLRVGDKVHIDAHRNTPGEFVVTGKLPDELYTARVGTLTTHSWDTRNLSKKMTPQAKVVKLIAPKRHTPKRKPLTQHELHSLPKGSRVTRGDGYMFQACGVGEFRCIRGPYGGLCVETLQEAREGGTGVKVIATDPRGYYLLSPDRGPQKMKRIHTVESTQKAMEADGWVRVGTRMGNIPVMMKDGLGWSVSTFTVSSQNWQHNDGWSFGDWEAIDLDPEWEVVNGLCVKKRVHTVESTQKAMEAEGWVRVGQSDKGTPLMMKDGRGWWINDYAVQTQVSWNAWGGRPLREDHSRYLDPGWEIVDGECVKKRSREETLTDLLRTLTSGSVLMADGRYPASLHPCAPRVEYLENRYTIAEFVDLWGHYDWTVVRRGWYADADTTQQGEDH